MEKNQKKLLVILSIFIAIFTASLVFRTFQNDTYFNIAIGKHLLENGIDMKEHFTWAADDLYYSHSHWLFDIIIYVIYNAFGFTGLYISTIILSISIAITLFVLSSKLSKSPIISFFVTLFSIYIIKDCFTARSQIVSFFFFVIEIYCIEKFIDTNKLKYAIIIIAGSIIVANMHAATWPLILILFLPYIASSLCNICTSKFIYTQCIKNLERKIAKLPETSKKIAEYQKDIEDYKRIINERKSEYAEYKVVRKNNYNTKNLIILMIIVALTGLITPIHGTPYTYIIKSMFGPSNFENGAISINYINEMKPIVPVNSIAFLLFTIVLVAFLIFVPSKIRTEHGFLLAGLYLMALTSSRYVYLLVLIGTYVLVELISYTTKLLIKDDIDILERIMVHPIAIGALIILFVPHSLSTLIARSQKQFVDEKAYPIAAVEYIKENIDYKNMRIYNSYNFGSYLMLHDIPVFIDSRLDVYCSEFNDTDIFRDFIYLQNGHEHYDDILDKYDCTHVLLQNDEIAYKYMIKDISYDVLYEDEYFTLFERN